MMVDLLPTWGESAMDYNREELLAQIVELVGEFFYKDITYDSPPALWLDRSEESAAVNVRIAAMLTGSSAAPTQTIEEIMKFEIESLRPAARDRAAKQQRPGGEVWVSRRKARPD
jgi:hypothetical protein